MTFLENLLQPGPGLTHGLLDAKRPLVGLDLAIFSSLGRRKKTQREVWHVTRCVLPSPTNATADKRREMDRIASRFTWPNHCTGKGYRRAFFFPRKIRNDARNQTSVLAAVGSRTYAFIRPSIHLPITPAYALALVLQAPSPSVSCIRLPGARYAAR